jgi:hypothetical protein
MGRPPLDLDVALAHRLAAEGRTNGAIAAALGCCPQTLQTRIPDLRGGKRERRESRRVPKPPSPPKPVSDPRRLDAQAEVPIVLRAHTFHRAIVHVRCPHCRRRHVVPLPANEDVSEPVRCPVHPKSEPLVAVRYREP